MESACHKLKSLKQRNSDQIRVAQDLNLLQLPVHPLWDQQALTTLVAPQSTAELEPREPEMVYWLGGPEERLEMHWEKELHVP